MSGAKIRHLGETEDRQRFEPQSGKPMLCEQAQKQGQNKGL